jgi:uncharacterized membrane protein
MFGRVLRRVWKLNEIIAWGIMIWALAFYTWQCGQQRRLLTFDEFKAAYYTFMHFHQERGQQ